jgi:sugar lactone lactonase YvrE
MALLADRFGTPELDLRDGWQTTYLLPPCRLFGANGIRGGADGRIHIAQLAGSRISAMDPDTGAIEHLATSGSSLVGPDDLAFDAQGNLYVTEFTENRVSVRAANGMTRVLHGDIPGANPITCQHGRLIVGECRMDARIMELDPAGGAPRLILGGIPMTNAFEIGPDGKLYFPVMATSEIWRINLDGSGCEVVAGDLGVPDSVKFDARGRIVTTQVGTGQVLRIDVQSGERTVLAEIAPGLDNCAFIDGRLFVSHMTGSIHEILSPGVLRELNPKGLLWPMGVATAADGSVYVADGSYAYVRPEGGAMALVGMIFTPGYPTFHRGAAAAGPGEWFVSTSTGEVRRWNPAAQENEILAEGFDRLMGLAATGKGALAFAESGTGRLHLLESGQTRILAESLDGPTGVAVGADDTIYVAESAAGRITRITSSGAETVAEGLGQPEGLAWHGGKLFVVDVAARALLTIDAASGHCGTIASGLPVGAPHGPRPYLGPAGEFSGPMLAFAGLAAGPDGTLYLGADGNGSVMAFHPQNRA